MLVENVPAIVWLGEPPAHDPVLVGPQGATLSQLVDQQRVPPGFFLTAAARRSASPLSAWIDVVSAAFGRLADQCGVPEPAVSVHPCPLDENVQGQSFLNRQGLAAVVAAIQECSVAAGAAVLVQQFVAADVTAIAYSINPATGNRDEAVIHATWGLGEGIQKGLVTPDIYIISKSNPVVYAVRVADKVRKLVAMPSGVGLVDVPTALRREMVLSEGQLLEITQLAHQLESLMGWSVQIECAYKDETIYVLQCRPIPALVHQNK